MNPYIIIVIIGILACSLSQILLKKSAQKSHKNWLLSILNWRVITAYSVIFTSLLINIMAMKHGVKLKEIPILESLSYIFVPTWSYFILNERISKRTIICIALIIIGITIFYLK